MPKKKTDPITMLILGAALIIFAIAGGLLLDAFVFNPPPTPLPAELIITANPTVRANATNIPNATPLSSSDSFELVQFKAQVASCADYTPERVSQMLQHIEWLIDPSTIPPDAITAFGANIQQTLIFGMATYTSIQWRLLDEPSDSCLVDIGRTVDVMLAAFGGEPLGIYGEDSQ